MPRVAHPAPRTLRAARAAGCSAGACGVTVSTTTTRPTPGTSNCRYTWLGPAWRTSTRTGFSGSQPPPLRTTASSTRSVARCRSVACGTHSAAHAWPSQGRGHDKVAVQLREVRHVRAVFGQLGDVRGHRVLGKAVVGEGGGPRVERGEGRQEPGRPRFRRRRLVPPPRTATPPPRRSAPARGRQKNTGHGPNGEAGIFRVLDPIEPRTSCKPGYGMPSMRSTTYSRLRESRTTSPFMQSSKRTNADKKDNKLQAAGVCNGGRGGGGGGAPVEPAQRLGRPPPPPPRPWKVSTLAGEGEGGAAAEEAGEEEMALEVAPSQRSGERSNPGSPLQP